MQNLMGKSQKRDIALRTKEISKNINLCNLYLVHGYFLHAWSQNKFYFGLTRFIICLIVR